MTERQTTKLAQALSRIERLTYAVTHSEWEHPLFPVTAGAVLNEIAREAMAAAAELAEGDDAAH